MAISRKRSSSQRRPKACRYIYSYTAYALQRAAPLRQNASILTVFRGCEHLNFLAATTNDSRCGFYLHAYSKVRVYPLSARGSLPCDFVAAPPKGLSAYIHIPPTPYSGLLLSNKMQAFCWVFRGTTIANFFLIMTSKALSLVYKDITLHIASSRYFKAAVF